MQPRFSRYQFRLRTLFVLVTVLAVILAFGSRTYIVVKQREAYRPRFNHHDSSVRGALVYKVEPDGPIDYSNDELPWLRRWMGDRPQSHLIYAPDSDPDGSQLRRARELFPEAKYWGWLQSPTLPEGVERLTNQHYIGI